MLHDKFCKILAGKTRHLTTAETQTLQRIYNANIALRRKLKKRECRRAVEQNSVFKTLKSLLKEKMCNEIFQDTTYS